MADNKEFYSRIIHKHDTEANWNKATSFIPLKGEIIIYDQDSNHNYPRIKIGDGTSKVSALSFIDSNKLSKLDYEWNKSYNAGGTAGYLLIGSFPMYDSNVTIDIDSTTTTTYHGTVIIATQNVSETSIGSAHTITVYGDPTGTISDAIRVVWNSGSRNYNVYFAPLTWSKNLIHIRALGNYLETIDESKICIQFTAGTPPTTTSGLSVINALKTNFNNYTLPVATSSTLGGVKVGSNITNSSGTISLTKANVTTALGYTPPTEDSVFYKGDDLVDSTIEQINAHSLGGLPANDYAKTADLGTQVSYTLEGSKLIIRTGAGGGGITTSYPSAEGVEF